MPFGNRHWDSPKALIISRERAAESVSPDIGIGPMKCGFVKPFRNMYLEINDGTVVVNYI